MGRQVRALWQLDHAHIGERPRELTGLRLDYHRLEESLDVEGPPISTAPFRCHHFLSSNDGALRRSYVLHPLAPGSSANVTTRSAIYGEALDGVVVEVD